jgi:LmbE family N-acetylglucosaminyl deacetylase
MNATSHLPDGALLIVGAHAFDAEAMAGGLAATWSARGRPVALLHVSLGEAGHTGKTVAAYAAQKRDEALRAARSLGAEARLLDQPDTEVAAATSLAAQVAQVVQELRPVTLVTHWRGSWHPDHVATHQAVLKALMLAGLGKASAEHAPHTPQALLFAENWEDSEGFSPQVYCDITSGFERWQAALAEYEVGKSVPPSFPYRDYYTALARMRGCLCGVRYAEAFLPASNETMTGLGAGGAGTP